MGNLGGGNGDNWPPDGGGQPEGLPGLPPDWGPIVIPDDLSALADESAAVRRELRRETRRAPLRRLVGLPPPPGPGAPPATPSVRLPLVIMVLAVIATLASLFLVTWGGSGRRNAAPVAPEQTGPRAAIPRLTLADGQGNPISLHELLPAVLVLTDGCDCATLVAATGEAVPPGVAVIAVGRTLPAMSPALPPPAASPPQATASPAAPGAASPSVPDARSPVRVRALADRTDALRTQLGLPGPGTRPVVLLADREGRLVRTVVAAGSIEDFRADLARLAGR